MIVGLLLALATSVAWAFGNVFIQRSGQALGGPRALIWALLLGAAMSGIAALPFDQRPAAFTGPITFWLAAAAVSGLVAYAGLFYAFAHAKLSIAVPFVSCWSLVAGGLSLTVFDEAIRPGQLLGAGIVLAGVVLVSIAAGRGESGADDGPRATAIAADGTHNDRSGTVVSRWKPPVAALLSGIGFGVMIPAMAQVQPAAGSFGTAGAVYLLGLLLAVPLAWRAGVPLAPPDRAAWPAVIGAGVFETVGFVCVNAAGRYAPTAVVAPVASLAAALTVVYAAVFLRERPGKLAFSGALLASIGVVVLAL